MGLRFGGFGVCRGVLVAREPDIASGNSRYRTQTRFGVWAGLSRLVLAGLRVQLRARVRADGSL